MRFLIRSFFQRTEERFSHRIIPAVATPAHAQRQVFGPAEALPVVTAVLAVLIAMYDNLAVRFSTPHGHHQSVQREFARESGIALYISASLWFGENSSSGSIGH